MIKILINNDFEDLSNIINFCNENKIPLSLEKFEEHPNSKIKNTNFYHDDESDPIYQALAYNYGAKKADELYSSIIKKSELEELIEKERKFLNL